MARVERAGTPVNCAFAPDTADYGSEVELLPLTNGRYPQDGPRGIDVANP